MRFRRRRTKRLRSYPPRKDVIALNQFESTNEGYGVNSFTDRYQSYELTEASTNSRIVVVPERGGIVTEFRAFGHDLLYLDPATVEDPNANIRGGIPILFPISGQLEGGGYEWEGKHYTMKNHGVARINAWEVVETRSVGEASITLKLQSSPSTKASYPFDFELLFTYILQGGKLLIRQEYHNRSGSGMPVYPGLHPYFLTDSKQLTFETDALRMYDQNDSTDTPFEGAIDFQGKSQAYFLYGGSRPEISFQPKEAYWVRLSYGEAFKYVVLWHEENKPFVCVEPWVAKTNEMNVRKELTIIPAGSKLETYVEISCIRTGA